MRKAKSKVSPREVTNTDRIVGENIRMMRNVRGLSLMDLAEAIGLTHQQVQKYEVGLNRVSCGTLSAIAHYFETGIENFFVDHGKPPARPTTKIQKLRQECIALVDAAKSERELKEMVVLLRVLSDKCR
jgi:transcriptional regulator with XRE-family HTH domain